MARLRAFLIGASFLLGAAVLAAWLVPPLLDWSRYRDNIAVLASAVLGRPVTIAGPVTLTLLPEPVLTAADVGVAGGDAGPNGGPGVGLAGIVHELRLRVALMPLLSGTVAARELVLRRPDIRVPWPLAPGGVSLRRPPWLGSVSARIEDGTLTIGSVTFTAIDANLSAGIDSAGSDSAGASAAGTAQRGGRIWRFTARTTGAGIDGVEGLDISLDGQGPTQGLGAVFSGQLAPDGTLAGRIDARGPDLSLVLPAPAVPFRAVGRVSLAAGLAAADDLALEIGGSPVHGAVTLRVDPAPRLDLALAASRLDLDAWLPVLLHRAGFPWQVGLDLSAEIVSFQGGLLRRLRANFEFSPDSDTAVREASAILPGDAMLHVGGRIARAGVSPRFTGQARLAAPDFRTTLKWLAASGLKPLSELPGGVLRTADVTAAVTADPQQVGLGNLRGRIDGAAVEGSLALALGTRLGLAGKLSVAPLVLDPWIGSGFGPASGDVAVVAVPFDADLALSAASGSWRGVAFHDFSLDGAVAGGRLTLRRLAATALGVQGQLSGGIGEGGRVSDARLDLVTAEAAPLAGLLPLAVRDRLVWRGPCRVEMRADGPPAALAVRLAVDLADARLEAQPLVDLPGRGFSGALTLRHPGATRLLQLLGVVAPGWLGDGSLALVAQVSGGPGRFAADKFELGAGALHAGGQLAWEPGKLSGRVAAEMLPVPLPDPRSVEPIALEALRGWQAAIHVEAAHVVAGSVPLADGVSAMVSLADGVLRVDQVAGVVDGGKVSGAAVLDAVAEPPTIAVRAGLAGAQVGEPLTGLPLDLVAGRLDGDVDVAASGHSPAAFLATLGGRLRVSATNGAVAGFDLSMLDEALGKDGSDVAVRQALSGGSTGFDSLDLAAVFARGSLVIGEGAMRGPAGGVGLSGSVDVAGGAVDLRAALRPVIVDGPEVAVRVSGPFGATRRSFELADVIKWKAKKGQGSALDPLKAEP